MARDSQIDDCIDQAAPFAMPILQHLRALIHAAVPDVTEARVSRIIQAAEWLAEEKKRNWQQAARQKQAIG